MASDAIEDQYLLARRTRRADSGEATNGALRPADHTVSAMSDFPITIFHNPACGTSRNTLGMIEAAGYVPTVVEYLKTGWMREQLRTQPTAPVR